jgi:hypothetical protein
MRTGKNESISSESLWDNEELLQEFSTKIREEVLYQLYSHRNFWAFKNKDDYVNNILEVMTFKELYSTFTQKTKIPSNLTCFVVFITQCALAGVFQRTAATLPLAEEGTPKIYLSEVLGDSEDEDPDSDTNMVIEDSPSHRVHQSKPLPLDTTEPSGSTITPKIMRPSDIGPEPMQSPNIVTDIWKETEKDKVAPPPKYTTNKPSSTKKKNKRKVKNKPVKILTGHVPTEEVFELLLYDVPATWTHEKLLAELMLWAKSYHLTPSCTGNTSQSVLK